MKAMTNAMLGMGETGEKGDNITCHLLKHEQFVVPPHNTDQWSGKGVKIRKHESFVFKQDYYLSPSLYECN